MYPVYSSPFLYAILKKYFLDDRFNTRSRGLHILAPFFLGKNNEKNYCNNCTQSDHFKVMTALRNFSKKKSEINKLYFFWPA